MARKATYDVVATAYLKQNRHKLMAKTREALDWCDKEIERFIVGKREAADNVARLLRE